MPSAFAAAPLRRDGTELCGLGANGTELRGLGVPCESVFALRLVGWF